MASVIIVNSSPNKVIKSVGETIILKPAQENKMLIKTVQGLPGAQGEPGAPAYEHTQSSSNATWVINHNLGYKPSVTIFSVGGVEVEAEAIHTSNNQTQVLFVTATAGSARLV